MNETEIKIKPRESLREPNFRRHEQKIARACKGSFLIDPKTENPPCKASSLSVSIREAMRGFRLYNYYSNLIPVNYPMKNIQLFETEDEKVYMRNETEDKLGMAAFNKKVDEDYPVIMENGKVTSVPGRKTKPRDFIYKDYSPESFNQLVESIRAGLDTRTDLYIVQTANKEEMQQIQDLIDSNPRKRIPGVELVKLTAYNAWMIE